MPNRLRVRVLRTIEECRTLRADWSRLVQMEGLGVTGFDVTATFEWSEALWQGFLNSAPQFVLVAEDDSGVRGILPCMITREVVHGIPRRVLSSIGALYELRTGFLVAGDADVLGCLFDYLRNHLKGWDTFVFRVVDTSPSDRALQTVAQRGHLDIHLQRQWLTPFIAVHQEPAQVLAGLKSNMRTRLRRRDKKLQTLGRLEMRLFDSEESVPEFLELMLAVETRSWKQQAGTAMTESERQKRFYALVTPVAAREDWFLGAALLLDDRPVAFQYGYAFGRSYVGEKTSYDNEYRDYGVGSALTARLLEVLSARGISAFDLGGEADANKAQWTDESYSRRMYVVYNSTLRGLLVKASTMMRSRWIAWRRPNAGAQPDSTTQADGERESP